VAAQRPLAAKRAERPKAAKRPCGRRPKGRLRSSQRAQPPLAAAASAAGQQADPWR